MMLGGHRSQSRLHALLGVWSESRWVPKSFDVKPLLRICWQQWIRTLDPFGRFWRFVLWLIIRWISDITVVTPCMNPTCWSTNDEWTLEDQLIQLSMNKICQVFCSWNLQWTSKTDRWGSARRPSERLSLGTGWHGLLVAGQYWYTLAYDTSGVSYHNVGGRGITNCGDAKWKDGWCKGTVLLGLPWFWVFFGAFPRFRTTSQAMHSWGRRCSQILSHQTCWGLWPAVRWSNKPPLFPRRRLRPLEVLRRCKRRKASGFGRWDRMSRSK